MRLIDADALKEKFENLASDDYNEPIWYQQTVFETVDNAPTVTVDNYSMGCQDGVRKVLSERPKGEWIPVSERLPEEKFSGGAFGFDFEEVLCTTIWGDVRTYKFGKPIGHDKPHFWLGGGIMDEFVIAWQPLPEPYKEADNG